jgi:hypothetical protein
MRHLYFKMPKVQADSPLIKGLETDRVYVIVGTIQIKNDSAEKALPHCLAIVYNPYISEDPRKNGELWSKSFLSDKKKN